MIELKNAIVNLEGANQSELAILKEGIPALRDLSLEKISVVEFDKNGRRVGFTYASLFSSLGEVDQYIQGLLNHSHRDYEVYEYNELIDLIVDPNSCCLFQGHHLYCKCD